MKHQRTFCDRCQKEILHTDDLVADQLAQDYPDRDICADCDQEIQLAGEIATNAALTKRSPKEVIANWLNEYGVEKKRKPNNA